MICRYGFDPLLVIPDYERNVTDLFALIRFYPFFFIFSLDLYLAHNPTLLNVPPYPSSLGSLLSPIALCWARRVPVGTVSSFGRLAEKAELTIASHMITLRPNRTIMMCDISTLSVNHKSKLPCSQL